MIYGINFGADQIPPGIKRMFADRMDAKFRRVGGDRGCAWRLVGVATSPEERNQMISTATNGSRKLHVIERKTAGAPFFGIYAG